MSTVDQYINNFMYVLNGTKVDYNILALNLYNKFGNSSSIKVGNYDKAAIS